MRRLPRLLLAGAIAAAVVAPRPADAAIAWGPQRTASNWAWTSGSALAVTGAGSSARVHLLYSSDFVDGSFATDHGPYEGVFVTSSDDRGQSWSNPVRVSQPAKHADRGALAADGSHLYAVWVTQTSYDHYDPSAHRILYVRADPNGADPNGWGPTVRLSKTKGRVDRATVAADQGRVYVTWTDANSGDVRMAITGDGGKTWKRSVVGKAKGSDPGGEGRVGLPSVAATGSTVGVSWLGTSDGAVKARLSTNGGRSWHPTVTLVPSGGGANGGSPAVAAEAGRLAFAWTTPGAVWARSWKGGVWSAVRRVAAFGGASGYSGGYDVAVALTGSVIGVAWSGCRSPCNPNSGLTRTSLLWSQAPVTGGSWASPDVIRAATAADQRIDDGASAIWIDPRTRLVAYAGYVAGFTTYRLYTRVGSSA